MAFSLREEMLSSFAVLFGHGYEPRLSSSGILTELAQAFHAPHAAVHDSAL
jgi:hypothetical protein